MDNMDKTNSNWDDSGPNDFKPTGPFNKDMRNSSFPQSDFTKPPPESPAKKSLLGAPPPRPLMDIQKDDKDTLNTSSTSWNSDNTSDRMTGFNSTSGPNRGNYGQNTDPSVGYSDDRRSVDDNRGFNDRRGMQEKNDGWQDNPFDDGQEDEYNRSKFQHSENRNPNRNQSFGAEDNGIFHRRDNMPNVNNKNRDNEEGFSISMDGGNRFGGRMSNMNEQRNSGPGTGLGMMNRGMGSMDEGSRGFGGGMNNKTMGGGNFSGGSSLGRGMSNVNEQRNDFRGMNPGGMMDRNNDINLNSGRGFGNKFNEEIPPSSEGMRGNPEYNDDNDRQEGGYKGKGAAEYIEGGASWIGRMDDDEYDNKGFGDNYQSSWGQNKRKDGEDRDEARDRGGRGDNRGDEPYRVGGEDRRDEGSFSSRRDNRGGRGEDRQSRGDKRLAMEIVKNPFDPAERSDRSQSNRIDEDRFSNPGMNPPAPNTEGRPPQMPPKGVGMPPGVGGAGMPPGVGGTGMPPGVGGGGMPPGAAGAGGQGGPDYAALLQYLQFYQKQMGNDEK